MSEYQLREMLKELFKTF